MNMVVVPALKKVEIYIYILYYLQHGLMKENIYHSLMFQLKWVKFLLVSNSKEERLK